MKPAAFEYHAPDTVEDAVALLEAHGDQAKILAGGQSLVPLMNMRLARPAVIIDINRIHALDYLTPDGDVLRIGALCRQRCVERSAVVEARCPLLSAAIRLIGHVQIRNRGTVVGSLAHADPAAEATAVFAVLGGTITAVGPDGTRTIPADEYFVSYLTTSLDPRELITEARFPVLPPGAGWSWREIARRHGDFALTGVGVVLTARAGTVKNARIGLTGVGPTPARAARAERVLVGRAPSGALWDEAAEAVRAEIDPDDDIHASAEYRRHVAGVLARRALAEAYARTMEAV
ncbi:MAG TPA: xanthine dehydrogenase family protein subunit M [bacterium]|nr:xanthine dehydrogenase family protein subunit M [bacterium]